MWCTSSKDRATAGTTFNKTDSKITELDVLWCHCVGFSVDNTSVNLEVRNSIQSRVLVQNKSYFFIGCPCHIIHNTAIKGGAAFTSITGFGVEYFCIELLNFDMKCSRIIS